MLLLNKCPTKHQASIIISIIRFASAAPSAHVHVYIYTRACVCMWLWFDILPVGCCANAVDHRVLFRVKWRRACCALCAVVVAFFFRVFWGYFYSKIQTVHNSTKIDSINGTYPKNPSTVIYVLNVYNIYVMYLYIFYELLQLGSSRINIAWFPIFNCVFFSSSRRESKRTRGEWAQKCCFTHRILIAKLPEYTHQHKFYRWSIDRITVGVCPFWKHAWLWFFLRIHSESIEIRLIAGLGVGGQLLMLPPLCY